MMSSTSSGPAAEAVDRFAQEYVDQLRDALASVDTGLISRIVEIVDGARRQGRRIFAVGNGGSASNASHFVNDLGKGASVGRPARFKVIPVVDNVEWLTSLGNDLSYADIFVEPLKNHAEPGDVLIAISGSGNSENVLRAVEYANRIGCCTIGLTGFDGGRLKDLAQHCVWVRSHQMGRVEDVHLAVLHMICYWFMEERGRCD